MLVIRFLRIGRKNQPSFKIVVTDKRRPPRGGRFVEILGFYNPFTKKKSIKKERVQYWLKNGAQPSDSVHNLLIENKIIEGKKINVAKKKKSKKEEKTEQPTQAATPEAPKEAPRQEKPKEEPKPETKTASEKPAVQEPQKPQEPQEPAEPLPAPEPTETTPKAVKEATPAQNIDNPPKI